MLQAITRDEHYDMLTNSDLSEVCELHARGQLVEVIAVSLYLDEARTKPFDGFIIAVGPIDGETFAHDGLHNVSCIGGNYEFLDGSRFYRATDHREAMTFAMQSLMDFDLVKSV